MSDDESDPTSPDRLRDLDTRLKALREERDSAEQADNQVPKNAMSGLGAAFRVGTELVGALIVGVGIGYLLDQWLGTTPWLLVVFFFLGSGAGVLNVYRAVGGQDFGEGFRPEHAHRVEDDTKTENVAEGSANSDRSDKQS